jgi:hypothetical protein
MRTCTALLAATCLWPAFSLADLTLSGYSTIGAFGMPMSSPEQIRIRDNQIRRDYIDQGRMNTQLFDLGRRQLILIDHANRKIETHDLKNMQDTTEANAPISSLKLTIERNGQARPLRHWHCEGYNLTASIPARLGQEETVLHIKGQLWLASNVPEQAEIKALVKLAQRKDFFLGIPAIAKTTPAQTQLFSEIIRRVAPQGMPCAGDLEASYEGSGPMTNLARKMPNRISIAFQNFSGQSIPPELFKPPAGYTIRP